MPSRWGGRDGDARHAPPGNLERLHGDARHAPPGNLERLPYARSLLAQLTRNRHTANGAARGGRSWDATPRHHQIGILGQYDINPDPDRGPRDWCGAGLCTREAGPIQVPRPHYAMSSGVVVKWPDRRTPQSRPGGGFRPTRRRSWQTVLPSLECGQLGGPAQDISQLHQPSAGLRPVVLVGANKESTWVKRAS
jgi:hypothetical protein